MAVGIVVQARMSSVRLPGKVLRKLAGRPAIDYLLDGLQRCCCRNRVCVATSDDPTDDPLEDYCLGRGVPCFRGPLEDVAGRCLAAARDLRWETFVRLSADSPLLDYRLVDRAVELAERTRADFVTNVFPRTFPRGQSVEVLRTELLGQAHQRMRSPRHLEHVTTYFYDHVCEYRLATFRAERNMSHISLALDTPQDEARIAGILSLMALPSWAYTVEDVVHLLNRLIPFEPARKEAA